MPATEEEHRAEGRGWVSHGVMETAPHSAGDPWESSPGGAQAVDSLPLSIARKESAWKEEFLFSLVVKEVDQPCQPRLLPA